MSFTAMAAAGAGILTTVTAGGLAAGSAGATIGGGILAGGALGAGTGAIGSAITGGDIGEGALMGAGTGAITAGLGSAIATPATTVAQTAVQQSAQAALNPIVNASGQVINQGTSLAAGQTAGQMAQQGIQQGAQQGIQQSAQAALNPITNASGQVINQGTSIPAGLAAAAPSSATPVGTELAKQGVQQGATNFLGNVAAPLSAPARVGLAGLSRTGVGLAAGEDIEQAGIAGLTAAGTTGLMSGLGELSANPVAGELSASDALARDIGSLPSTDTQLIPNSDLSSQIQQGIAGPGAGGTAVGNPMGMPKFQSPALSNISPDWTPASDSWTAAAGKTTGDLLPAPDLTPLSNYQPIEGSLGPAPLPEPSWYQMKAEAPTNLTDRPGNLYNQFNTTDKAIDSAKFLAPETTLTAGGLYAQKQLGIEDEEAAAEEKRKRGYSQSIWNNYMSQGRMPHESSSLYKYGFANGGIVGLTNGLGDGTSDSIPAVIDGGHPARLSSNEFVIPADVVSHIGNGSTEAGAQSLYDMMDRLRVARTNSSQQPNDINPRKYLPA